MKIKSYSARTDQGPYLEINEDAVETDLVNNLYMIFDGFGGSGAGDRAVTLARDTIKQFFTKVGGDPDATMPFYFSHQHLLEGNALINSMRHAHNLLKEENNKKEMNQRGGTSAIVIALSDNILVCAGVGNCQAMLYRKGKLQIISSPDNFCLLSGDSYDREFSTAPTSGLGIFDDVHININEVRVQKDDQVVLITDGIYSRVDLVEIKDVLSRQSVPAQERIDDLFALSNSRGNLDNQSILILNF